MLPTPGTRRKLNDLVIAICQGNINRVNDLISSSDPLLKEYFLLQTAIKYNQYEIVKLLIRVVDVNAANKHGFTVLHYATYTKMHDMALVLIRYGANVNAEDKCKQTPLHFAVESGSIQTVKAFLQHGADINARSIHGSTMLHVAVARGHRDIVKLILSKDVDVNVQNVRGESPLHIAVKKMYTEIAERLLIWGASVHSVSRNGYTPLHMACQNGLDKIAELLLRKGADVNAVAECRITPIHIAMRSCDYKLVLLLLRQNANVDTEDENGKTILRLAVEHECLLMVYQILSYNPSIDNNSNNSALQLAMNRCPDNFNHMVDYLVRYGFTIDPKDANYLKFLRAVVTAGCPTTLENLLEFNAGTRNIPESLNIVVKKKLNEVIELLLEHGYDRNAVDSRENSVLHDAVLFDEYFLPREDDIYSITDLTKVLLKKGRCINLKSKIQLTTLHLAVKNGHKNVLQILAERCADVNLKSESGVTLLHFVAEEGLEDICRILIERGADVNAKGVTGFTPLHLAIDNGHRDIVEILLEHGADVTLESDNGMTPLHFVAQEGTGSICRMLIERGADVNAESENGYTALHLAAKDGHRNIAEILLKHGADVTSKSQNGATPLHFVAESGRTKFFTLLFEGGADVNAKTGHGLTPLHVAAICDHVCALEVLLDSGADIDSTDENGNTALHVAILIDRVRATLTLIENGSDLSIVNQYGQMAFDVIDDPDVKRPLRMRCGRNLFITDKKHKRYIYRTWHSQFNSYHSSDYVHCSGDEELDSMSHVIKRYLIKLKIANLEMNKENLEDLKISPDEKIQLQFEDECEEEISRMKSTKINNTNVTFYDILTKRIEEIALYTRNKDVVRVLKLTNYQKEFPEYAIVIKNRFNVGMKRKKLLDDAIKFFLGRNSGHLCLLPLNCIDKVLSFLSNADLMSLKGSHAFEQ